MSDPKQPAKRRAPAFLFYVDDFLGGTFTMSHAEVGLYVRLLCYQWHEGAVPNDRAFLERFAAGCPLDQVLAKFRFNPGSTAVDGRLESGCGLVNERLEQVRSERDKFLLSQAEKGKASAEKRRLERESLEKSNRGSTAVQPDTQPNGQPGGNSPIPSPSPTKDTASTSAPLALEAEAPKTPRPKKPSPTLGAWELIAGVELPEKFRSLPCLTAVKEWLAYKREKGQAYKQIGLAKMLVKWANQFEASQLPLLIDHAIGENWSGVYPLKDGQKPQGAPSTPQIQARPITDPTDFRLIHNLPNHCEFIWQHWLGQDPECNLVREYKKDTTPPERKKEIMDQAIWCWKRNGDKIRNYWSQYTL